MKIIGIVVYVIVQLVFIPFLMVGMVLTIGKPKIVSRKLGVSSTAISVLVNRWLLHLFGIRKDPAAARLFYTLPNSPVLGMWLLILPAYIAYRINGINKGFAGVQEPGKETLRQVGPVRERLFDSYINKSIDTIGQLIIMGAGYDTRCYGTLKRTGLKLFELDQPNTQKLKKDCLRKAEIDLLHVTFVDVDFSQEQWYAKLERAGYDPGKKTLFILQGVTLYLSENDVRNTFEIIRHHAATGSIIITDLYDTKKVGGMRSIQTEMEAFKFGLDLQGNGEETLTSFVESVSLTLRNCNLMGHRTKQGAFGAVMEIIV